ncbi:MAG: Crp/Fnr family transcriptional regulator [Halanaerobiaceae bacterium]
MQISELPLFNDLGEDEIEVLKDYIFVREYEPDQFLFLEGEEADSFYVILEGEVRIVRETLTGKEKILKILCAGEFFGEMGILEDKSRSATARITEKSRLLVISREKFLNFVRQYPEVVFNIIIVLSQRLRRANREIEELAFLDVEDRLHKLLLRRAKKEAGEYVIHQQVTHQELARLLGTSRETVTRAFGKLKDKEVVETREQGEIVVREEK